MNQTLGRGTLLIAYVILAVAAGIALFPLSLMVISSLCAGASDHARIALDQRLSARHDDTTDPALSFPALLRLYASWTNRQCSPYPSFIPRSSVRSPSFCCGLTFSRSPRNSRKRPLSTALIVVQVFYSVLLPLEGM